MWTLRRCCTSPLCRARRWSNRRRVRTCPGHTPCTVHRARTNGRRGTWCTWANWRATTCQRGTCGTPATRCRSRCLTGRGRTAGSPARTCPRYSWCRTATGRRRRCRQGTGSTELTPRGSSRRGCTRHKTTRPPRWKTCRRCSWCTSCARGQTRCQRGTCRRRRPRSSCRDHTAAGPCGSGACHLWSSTRPSLASGPTTWTGRTRGCHRTAPHRGQGVGSTCPRRSRGTTRGARWVAAPARKPCSRRMGPDARSREGTRT